MVSLAFESTPSFPLLLLETSKLKLEVEEFCNPKSGSSSELVKNIFLEPLIPTLGVNQTKLDIKVKTKNTVTVEVYFKIYIENSGFCEGFLAQIPGARRGF